MKNEFVDSLHVFNAINDSNIEFKHVILSRNAVLKFAFLN